MIEHWYGSSCTAPALIHRLGWCHEARLEKPRPYRCSDLCRLTFRTRLGRFMHHLLAGPDAPGD